MDLTTKSTSPNLGLPKISSGVTFETKGGVIVNVWLNLRDQNRTSPENMTRLSVLIIHPAGEHIIGPFKTSSGATPSP